MIIQMLTFGIVVQGETNPLQSARITAVNLINLNRVLRILLHSFTILPDILIWSTTKPQACQLTESMQRLKIVHHDLYDSFFTGDAAGHWNA